MTTEQKIIRAKVGLLELAKQLGNVTEVAVTTAASPGRDSTVHWPLIEHARTTPCCTTRNRPPCFDEQVCNRATDTDRRHVRSDFVGALIRASRYEAEGALRQLQRGPLVIRRAGEHEFIKSHRSFGTNREIRAVLEDKLRRTIATGGHQLLAEYILAGIDLKSPRSQRPIDLVANRNGNANQLRAVAATPPHASSAKAHATFAGLKSGTLLI